MIEVTIHFPGGSKPAAASSTDEGRPHLTGVWIEPGDSPGEAFAISTDSYKLAKIPVTYEGKLPEGKPDHPLWLPADVVKDVTRRKSGGSVRVTDKTYEPQHDARIMYRRSADDEKKIVNHNALWPEFGKDSEFEFGINAKLLLDLAKALGGGLNAVAITVDTSKTLKAMRVRPLGGPTPDARGIMMPVRVNV